MVYIINQGINYGFVSFETQIYRYWPGANDGILIDSNIAQCYPEGHFNATYGTWLEEITSWKKKIKFVIL